MCLRVCVPVRVFPCACIRACVCVRACVCACVCAVRGGAIIIIIASFMEVSREELYLFLQKTGAGSIAALKALAPKLVGLIAADKAFTDFYLWNFHYYRNAQEEQKKFLPVATASQVLGIITTKRGR